jgi:hypothetical protein
MRAIVASLLPIFQHGHANVVMAPYAVNPFVIGEYIITTDNTDGHGYNSGRAVYLSFVYFVLFVVILYF